MSGRLELIKSVLHPMISFWIQICQMSSSIIKKVDTIYAHFLWSSKQYKINWDGIRKPKQENGLGLREIQDMQNATSIKLLWKLLENNNSWAE